MAAWSDKLICERQQAAEVNRAAILPYIKACLELTMPWRLPNQQGAAAFQRLFDSTGATGVTRAASRLQRDLTPPFQRWFELEAGPLVPEAMTERLNRQLAPITEILHATLDHSAFSSASLEGYGDLMVSTLALLAVEGDDQMPIHWTSAPAWALSFENGPGGRADNTFWEKAFPAWILPRHWPKADWPEKVQTKIDAQSSDPVTVLQATYYDPEILGWRLSLVCKDGGEKAVVYDSARDRTNPWIIARYWTSPGDPWGRGPVMLGLPDMRTANKTVEMILKAAAFNLAPPLMITNDGVINPDQLRLAPHALIKVTRTGGPMGPTMQPLNIGANVDVGNLVLEEMRTNIRRNLMDSQTPPMTGAVRSASEWIERSKETSYDHGAAFGRLNHEYVPQVIARVLDVLDRKKVARLNWNELRVDQLFLKVKVTSPLARSQNLEDVQVIIQFWEMVKALGGEAAFLQIANQEGWWKVAKLMGVPLWAVNDNETRALLAKAAGAMASQMMAGSPEGGGPQMGLAA